ncbi:MAG: two-component regulator propeller domain-containing protein [Fluviicola sp.]
MASFLLINLLGWTQKEYFKINKLTSEDGLSFRHVTSVTQDQQGFIWIGTRDGLNKFDGYEFTVYTDRAENDLPAIMNNYVHDVKVANDGKLWIATETGLSILSTQDNRTKQYTTKDIFRNSTVSSSIDAISITKTTGRIFVHSHTEKTFDKLYTTAEFKNGTFKTLQIQVEGKTHQYFANVFEDNQKRLWVRPAMHGTFYQLDQNYKVVSSLQIPDYINGAHIGKAFPDRFPLKGAAYKQNQEFVRVLDDELIVSGVFCDGDSIQVVHCNISKGTFQHLPDLAFGGDRMPLNQFYDDEQNLWYPEGNGFDLYAKGTIQKVSSEELDLSARTTTCFYQSNDKTVWIGTNFGLIRVRKTTIPFQLQLQTQLNDEGYGRSMRGISNEYEDWVYTGVVHDGVWAFNVKTGEEKQILSAHEKSNIKEHDLLPYAIEAQDNQLWICNWFDDGVLNYNLTTKELRHITSPRNTSGFGRCMLRGKNGRIWLGTDRGLNVIDTKNMRVSRFPYRKAPENFDNVSISVLAHSEKEQLWIGTNDGLYSVNKNDEVSLYSRVNKVLKNKTILSICESNNILWIGTTSGLLKIYLDDGKSKLYTERDGLPNNKIYAIQNLDNILWITTDKGICRFNPMDVGCVIYSTQEGIPHNEFNFSSTRKLNEATILFGGMNGIVSINAKSVAVKPSSYSILLTRMEKFDNESNRMRSYNVDQSQTIDIYPDDKFFTLHFAMLDLFSSENISYAYQLVGYSDHWINIGAANSVRFSQLPPGEYTLLVKAQGSDGTWNQKQLSVRIRVHEVFYKTWWFLMLVFLSFIGVVFIVLNYRKRQRQKLQLLRLKIASDLHDDVGGVLAQIGVQAEMIKEGIYDEKEEKDQMEQIASNSRDAVRAMSDVLWSIDIREEKMHDLIDRMKGYALEMLTTRNIDVHFEIETLENKQLDLDFRQNVYLAFKEMINNVIKHSNASAVRVKISKKSSFVLQVSDNGTQFEEKVYKGQGMRNLNMRAERINGRLEIDRSNGFTVTLIA